MRVIGIDCGSRVTGYGVIDSDGYRHTLVACGAIAPPRGGDLAARLLAIHTGIAALLAEYQPECAAVEDIFFAENVRSAIKLGHARGVVLQALAAAGVAIAEYTPLAIKSALTGYGRAEKEQVAQMVKTLLRLEAPPQPLDATDALAAAICHLHTRNPA